MDALISFQAVQSAGESLVAKAKAYTNRLGVAVNSKDLASLAGAVFLNGVYFPLDSVSTLLMVTCTGALIL